MMQGNSKQELSLQFKIIFSLQNLKPWDTLNCLLHNCPLPIRYWVCTNLICCYLSVHLTEKSKFSYGLPIYENVKVRKFRRALHGTLLNFLSLI